MMEGAAAEIADRRLDPVAAGLEKSGQIVAVVPEMVRIAAGRTVPDPLPVDFQPVSGVRRNRQNGGDRGGVESEIPAEGGAEIVCAPVGII